MSAREVVKVGPLRVIVTTERLVTSGRWVATFTVMEGFYLIGDGSRVGATDGAAHTEARHAGEALAVGVAEAMLRAERRGRAQGEGGGRTPPSPGQGDPRPPGGAGMIFDLIYVGALLVIGGAAAGLNAVHERRRWERAPEVPAPSSPPALRLVPRPVDDWDRDGWL